MLRQVPQSHLAAGFQQRWMLEAGCCPGKRAAQLQAPQLPPTGPALRGETQLVPTRGMQKLIHL